MFQSYGLSAEVRALSAKVDETQESGFFSKPTPSASASTEIPNITAAEESTKNDEEYFHGFRTGKFMN